MRRELSMVLVVALLLFACNGDDTDPPDPDPEPDPVEETTGPSGLRVGVVLPAADAAAADEIDTSWLRLEELADGDEELAEVRVVVPDGDAFVADVAGLLADDHELVCVLGPEAESVVTELATRRAGTEFCALPADPEAEVADNATFVALEMEELGHVLGAALGALGGGDPAEALLGAQRTARDRFREGMRVGFGDGELREVTGDLDDLEAELDDAIENEVTALLLDAGPDGTELAQRAAAAMPTIAPATLLAEGDAALTWRVRWDRALEAILAWRLDDELDRPTSLGLQQEVFELTSGGHSTSSMRAVVETVAGELARDDRDALEVGGDAEEADDGDG